MSGVELQSHKDLTGHYRADCPGPPTCTALGHKDEGRVPPCEHPAKYLRVDVFKTAVPRSHPGYRESRRETCTACGHVVYQSGRTPSETVTLPLALLHDLYFASGGYTNDNGRFIDIRKVRAEVEPFVYAPRQDSAMSEPGVPSHQLACQIHQDGATCTCGASGRVSSSVEGVSESFTAAWLECINEHEATLVSGPCQECCAKHARLLRENR